MSRNCFRRVMTTKNTEILFRKNRMRQRFYRFFGYFLFLIFYRENRVHGRRNKYKYNPKTLVLRV